MTYAILDDKFHSNIKILEAGNEGAGVYARALSFCGDHNTDGFIPHTWAKSVTTTRTIKRITEARLWRPVNKGDRFTVEASDGTQVEIEIRADGFYIDDFLMLNQRRELVIQAREEIRRKRSEAGKKGAAARWQTGHFANGKNDATALANAWQIDGPQPQPQLLKDSLQQQKPSRDGSTIGKLLNALTDATARTERTVRKLVDEGNLNEADIAWAYECATGPGVNSPTRVAVAELKKRASSRARKTRPEGDPS